MTRRSTRGAMRDPERFFESLAPARQACIDQLRELPPAGPHYAMIRVIIAALDVAAEFFTHRRSFFLSSSPDMVGARVPKAEERGG
ncbi:hypothetical protein ASD21_02425 [Caulobacter sp. Root1455]|uniref:hypothetical protein n=1 Tax=Caulobacter sp. Root1455 TaxID=1736465 RepID=UPI0006F95567|nr:hypothetical protein [Caulobacter sp. Root1455]KQZ06509.1 hypothetical protein ASD21_02425 [Caulobacter sp. Root1455]